MMGHRWFGRAGATIALAVSMGLGNPARGEPPKPADPNPTTTAAYAEGDLVEVEWRGTWYKAIIIRQEDGRSYIQYEGFGESWNEWVPAERVRPRAQPKAAVPPEAAPRDPSPAPRATSQPVAVPSAGSEVEFLADGKWSAGTVVKVENNKALVRPQGSWSDTFNVWVGPSRLRLPGSNAALAEGFATPAGVWSMDALSGRSVLIWREDGSYLHYGPMFKYAGEWKPNADGTYTLPRTHEQHDEDWTVALRDAGEQLTIRLPSRVSMLTASRQEDASRLIQEEKTPAEFFLGAWQLMSYGTAINAPAGRLTIEKDQSAAYIGPGGEEASGTWKASDKFDGVVVVVGERTFSLMQHFADNQSILLHTESGTRLAGTRAATNEAN